jgi:hypothetical protein
MPPRLTSSADLDAAIERVAPDVLAPLADGVPRNRAAIVAVLAERHPKQDVKPAIARLSILGQLHLHGSRYTLPAPEAEQG